MAILQLPRMLSTSTVVFGLFIAATAYLLYVAALPKPIPGIPYSKRSAKVILGDVPDLLQWQSQRGELFSFLVDQTVKHNSPIIQLFLRPFGKPWVVMCDFRESQDIMVRRTKEFDRSGFFGDLLITLFPNNAAHMATNDEWRSHRKLIADAMSTSFLHTVSAHHIYSTSLLTVQLWKQKMRLVQNHPIDMREDVFTAILETIWGVTFGQQSECHALQAQIDFLSDVHDLNLPQDAGAAACLPSISLPKAFRSILALGESCEIVMSSPMPRLHHGLAMRLVPSLAAAKKHKDTLIREQLRRSGERFSQGNEGSGQLQSAMDLIVQREMITARNEGRKAHFDTRMIQDELFGFIVAGHDTTSTTLLWGPKFLTMHQRPQLELRAALKGSFSHAASARRQPTVEEIMENDVPYLDATIEEILRCANTASAHIRRATTDVEILGHAIPYGTDVFIMVNGPDFVAKPFDVNEDKRSKSSQGSKSQARAWDVKSIDSFQPERWLEECGSAREVKFNPRAGPTLPFGAGPCQCYGRKLAVLQLRILLVLIIWNLELQPIPEALTSNLGHDVLTHRPRNCYLRLAEVR